MSSSTPRPHFTRGKDPVPILQEAGWAPGQVWTGGKSRPHRDSIPDCPARSQSLYRLNHPAHFKYMYIKNIMHLVGIKKLFPPKLNLPDDFSLKQAQSKCCQYLQIWNERVSKKKFHSIHPNFRHSVEQTGSPTPPREADHCSLDCNLQNGTAT